MLQALKERLVREHREEGFTLIELMVVVLIIAILLAIAIPTFLGARNTANARAAQSNLRNALTAEKTIYTDSQNYSQDATTGGVLLTNESAIAWTTGAPANTGNAVGVATDGNQVVLEAQGKDGYCYAIVDTATTSGTETAGTQYYKYQGTCPTPAVPIDSTMGTGHSTTTGAGW